MRVLVIGGTGLTGRHVVRELVDANCDVTIFHRGVHEAPSIPASVRHVHGRYGDLAQFKREFAEVTPDVVVHMVAITEVDAERFVETFEDLPTRLVVISSIDVYRAYGRIHRTEPGEPDPVPLDEDAPLRELLGPEGLAHEKRFVERVVMSASIDGTVLRYPAVYGPGDRQRLVPYLRRMVDHRPFIVLDERLARWRFSRGYSRNVAHAVALAVLNPAAAGRTYNVAEPHAFSEREWVTAIARAAHWDGEIIPVAPERVPPHLRMDIDFRQDWVVDSTRLRSELGFEEITSVSDALRASVEWELQHPEPQAPIDYGLEDEAAATRLNR